MARRSGRPPEPGARPVASVRGGEALGRLALRVGGSSSDRGAGPPSAVAALALQKGAWEPELHEAYERSAGLGQGVFLTIAVNGLDALAAVGADEAVRELGFPTGAIRFLSGTGKELGALPIGPRLADGTVTRTLRRADLYAVLCRPRGRARDSRAPWPAAGGGG